MVESVVIESINRQHALWGVSRVRARRPTNFPGMRLCPRLCHATKWDIIRIFDGLSFLHGYEGISCSLGLIKSICRGRARVRTRRRKRLAYRAATLHDVQNRGCQSTLIIAAHHFHFPRASNGKTRKGLNPKNIETQIHTQHAIKLQVDWRFFLLPLLPLIIIITSYNQCRRSVTLNRLWLGSVVPRSGGRGETASDTQRAPLDDSSL